jgi:hypothetical protein
LTYLAAVSSLLKPLAISRQNGRSTFRCSDGFPGDFIGALPVSSVIHPVGLPISTSTIKVLRGPLELAQFTSWAFSEKVRTAGLALSMGAVGSPYDNAVMEAFSARMQVLNRHRWRTRIEFASKIFEYLLFHNKKRQLDQRSPSLRRNQPP